MWSTGVRVQISSILAVVVATGVGVEMALVPRPATTGPSITGRRPLPTRRFDPRASGAGRAHEPDPRCYQELPTGRARAERRLGEESFQRPGRLRFRPERLIESTASQEASAPF